MARGAEPVGGGALENFLSRGSLDTEAHARGGGTWEIHVFFACRRIRQRGPGYKTGSKTLAPSLTYI